MHRLLAAGFLGTFTAWAQPCSASGTLADANRMAEEDNGSALAGDVYVDVMEGDGYANAGES